MDRIRDAFLCRQFEDAMALNAASDLVRVLPIDERMLAAGGRFALPVQGGVIPDRYVARFTCKGLVLSAAGEVVEADEFFLGISFASDYLRRVVPFQAVIWLGPRNIHHPNVVAPVICLGRLTPGTPLVDITDQCFQIITYQKVTMREDDALNRDACAWARRNQHLFPVDPRPLRRRAVDFTLESLP